MKRCSLSFVTNKGTARPPSTSTKPQPRMAPDTVKTAHRSPPLEDSVIASSRTEHALTTRPNNSLPWFLPKGAENTCTQKPARAGLQHLYSQLPARGSRCRVLQQVTDAPVHPDSGLLSYTRRSTIRLPEMLSTREAVHIWRQEAPGTTIILPT